MIFKEHLPDNVSHLDARAVKVHYQRAMQSHRATMKSFLLCDYGVCAHTLRDIQGDRPTFFDLAMRPSLSQGRPATMAAKGLYLMDHETGYSEDGEDLAPRDELALDVLQVALGSRHAFVVERDHLISSLVREIATVASNSAFPDPSDYDHVSVGYKITDAIQNVLYASAPEAENLKDEKPDTLFRPYFAYPDLDDQEGCRRTYLSRLSVIVALMSALAGYPFSNLDKLKHGEMPIDFSLDKVLDHLRWNRDEG